MDKFDIKDFENFFLKSERGSRTINEDFIYQMLAKKEDFHHTNIIKLTFIINKQHYGSCESAERIIKDFRKSLDPDGRYFIEAIIRDNPVIKDGKFELVAETQIMHPQCLDPREKS